MENTVPCVFLEEKLRLWGKEFADRGSQMFSLVIQCISLCISEWSCKIVSSGSPFELLPVLVYEISSIKPIPYVYFTRKPICLWYDNWSCSWIFNPIQDKAKICSTRNFKFNVSFALAWIMQVLTKINLVVYSCWTTQGFPLGTLRWFLPSN